MILADTSVWIDHLRSGDPLLMQALDHNAMLMHPYVLGEIALGNLGDRRRSLHLLGKLPAAVLAEPGEAAQLIEGRRLYGLGIGYVDVHLLASTLLTRDATLWTRDRRLHAISERLGIAAHVTQ